MADWTCPDAELVMSVEDIENDRDGWLELRRKGLGGSDIAPIFDEGKFSTAYDVWLGKTGRVGEREPTIQMEMGMRMEAAIAEKFAADYGLAIRRRGMLRSRLEPILQFNADRLTEDNGILECKSVNQFTKMPTDLSVRGGMRNDWYWQCVAGLLVTGRNHAYLAVGIGNSDFQVRSIDRSDPQVAADMERIAREAPEWWKDYVEGDAAPKFEGMPDLSEVLEGSKYEAIIPDLLREKRDRLREIRETAKALKLEGEELKKELEAEAGGAEWLCADGVPLLHFNPTKGRKTFLKAQLFKQRPLDGARLERRIEELAEAGAGWLDLLHVLSDFEMTEAQFTKVGDPGKSLLIVGKGDEDDE